MLTQTEANALIAMPKTFVQSPAISFPPGVNRTYELVEVGAISSRLVASEDKAVEAQVPNPRPKGDCTCATRSRRRPAYKS